jgi:hypothetical protein
MQNKSFGVQTMHCMHRCERGPASAFVLGAVPCHATPCRADPSVETSCSVACGCGCGVACSYHSGSAGARGRPARLLAARGAS